MKAYIIFLMCMILTILLTVFLQGCSVQPPDFPVVKVEVNHCEAFCNSVGQGYVRVIQDSMGTCICGNEEGYKVQKAYHKYLNNCRSK